MFDATACPFHEVRALIEASLNDLLRGQVANPAARYAVFSGGKRMRPMLTLLAVQACGGDLQQATPVACAIEFLHSASLIWDDMPCMDNACERRGIPAVHLMFGEGMATLAALDLLNRAYTIFGRTSALAAEAGECVAETIAGQVMDLQGAGECPNRKTTGLMRLTLTAGAIASGAPDVDVRVLARCGEFIGEAYQIYDDFKDGDLASCAGADDLVAGAKSNLQQHFGPRVSALVAAVDAIVNHCAQTRLVAA